MNLKCPICNQVFPKFDQRGFRNAGFTSHYNRCIERQKEHKSEQYDQGSSRASRFARAIKRRLLPAHHLQNRHIPSIQLTNSQTADGSALNYNGSSNSPSHSFYQVPMTIFPPHILIQQQQQQQQRKQQTEHHWNNIENRNHICSAAVAVARGLPSSFLFYKSLDLRSIPTTAVTTPPTLCDRPIDHIHNIRPCRSLPAMNYDLNITSSSSSPLYLSTNPTTSSDISISDMTISPSLEWISTPIASSSPLTTTSTMTENPMTSTFLDQDHHPHHQTIFNPSLSITQNMLVTSYTIQTSTSTNTLSSSSTNLTTTPIIQPTLIDYHDPLFTTSSSSSSSSSSLAATTKNVAAATTSQLSLHDNLFSSTLSPISSSSPSGALATTSSHPLFDYMNPNMVTTTNSPSHPSTPVTMTSTLNINHIYDPPIQYCQYCQSTNEYHLPVCPLMNYFMSITENH